MCRNLDRSVRRGRPLPPGPEIADVVPVTRAREEGRGDACRDRSIGDVEERDRIRNWQPPITGNDIMQLFGLKEGREVGIIKNKIREAILEGEILNDYDAALAFTIAAGPQIGLKVVESSK